MSCRVAVQDVHRATLAARATAAPPPLRCLHLCHLQAASSPACRVPKVCQVRGSLLLASLRLQIAWHFGHAGGHDPIHEHACVLQQAVETASDALSSMLQHLQSARQTSQVWCMRHIGSGSTSDLQRRHVQYAAHIVKCVYDTRGLLCACCTHGISARCTARKFWSNLCYPWRTR